MSLTRQPLKFGCVVFTTIALLLLLRSPFLHAQTPQVVMTPLAADQLLWKTYSTFAIPKGQQRVMAVRLVPMKSPYCWVDVLVTKTAEGGEMFQRQSCDKPPTGDFRRIGYQRPEQMQRLVRSLQSSQYRRYDRTRFGTTRPRELRHEITYMSQEATIQAELNQELPIRLLPTPVRDVLQQFWMMLSENVT
jgi:hypothetical protein